MKLIPPIDLGEPVVWGQGCQPVRVQWDAPRLDEPWAHWQLSLRCEGCNRWRQLEVWRPIAENVEMAEKVEEIQLAALHTPG